MIGAELLNLDRSASDADRASGQPEELAREASLETASSAPQALHEERDRPSAKPIDAEPDRDDHDEDDTDEKPPGALNFLKRHKVAVVLTVVGLVVAIALGTLWWLHARHFVSTDDAFIDGRPVSVSPEVTGDIVEVPVTDNQFVHAGDLLASIDPRNYRAADLQADAQIQQAEASVETSRAQIGTQRDQISQATQQVGEAEAALSFAKLQNGRAQNLMRSGAGTVQNAQQAASDLKSKQGAYDAAVAARDAAQRQLAVINAQIESAQGQLAAARAQKATAQANLSRTQIHATLDGRVTRLTGAVGAAATPGQALMVVVPSYLWVTANFKETQLADMRAGQPVDIEIDSYGRSFPGHVDSVQAGSGTAFSLLPAENATGNYVKVVQRVPVKLTFDAMPDVEIGVGMSVVPTVRVR